MADGTTSGREFSSQNNVVVIGQGAAGLCAAMVLAKQGLKVTSMSKVSPGKATCTIYAGGGFTLGVGGVTPDYHREMTWETGRHLNIPELLETFVNEAPGIVDLMSDAGVPFRVRRGGISLDRDEGFPLLGGKSLTDALHKACVEQGVRFLTNSVAVRLLTGDAGITGVEYLNHSTGDLGILPADAVVLATGGAGALYTRTDNPQRITGDGYYLALEAGCHLIDMEFVQFYPIGLDIPNGPHWFMDLGIIDKARLLNDHGEEFLKKRLADEGITSGRQANLLARDKCTVWISLENKNAQVYLYLSDIPKEEWESDRYLSSIARMFPRNQPPWESRVPVNPTEHYFPGGVAIGTWGETEIPGLFAAGEVTGGVDGANRVGGNALSNCLVFGQRAARAAAQHALGDRVKPLSLDGSAGQSPVVVVDMPKRLSAKGWINRWTNDSGTKLEPRSLRETIRRVASTYLTPVRDQSGLDSAVNALQEVREHLELQEVRTSHDLLLALENIGLLYTAISVAKSARERQESRGPHFRTDFPKEDSRWLKHIYASPSNGQEPI